MARPIPDLDPMTAAEVATNDNIIIDDTSAGETKRIPVGELLGLPKIGWTAAGEVWTFDTWNATTRIGTINVPSGATNKYTVKNRVMITQATGGIKYGIIHKVENTKLTVHVPNGTTLNNEAITTPYYSQQDSPQGFNSDPTIWELRYLSNAEVAQSSPTLGVWYNINSSLLALGIGAYDLYYEANIETLRATNADAYSTLSTSNSTESDKDFSAWSFIGNGVASNNNVHPTTRRKRVTLASASTFYLLFKTSAGNSQLKLRGADGTTKIIALTAYL